jgi:alkylated DNA nucleotide flippase Atl1
VADFEQAVRAVIAALPPGETFSYGWVADEAGYPGRARSVGALLAGGGDGLPWWRVVRSDGSFAEHLAREQSRRLRAEGVAVTSRRVRERPHHVPRGQRR